MMADVRPTGTALNFRRFLIVFSATTFLVVVLSISFSMSITMPQTLRATLPIPDYGYVPGEPFRTSANVSCAFYGSYNYDPTGVWCYNFSDDNIRVMFYTTFSDGMIVQTDFVISRKPTIGEVILEWGVPEYIRNLGYGIALCWLDNKCVVLPMWKQNVDDSIYYIVYYQQHPCKPIPTSTPIPTPYMTPAPCNQWRGFTTIP